MRIDQHRLFTGLVSATSFVAILVTGVILIFATGVEPTIVQVTANTMIAFCAWRTLTASGQDTALPKAV